MRAAPATARARPLAPATVRSYVAAVNSAHRYSGIPPPIDIGGPVLRLALAGYSRLVSTAVAADPSLAAPTRRALPIAAIVRAARARFPATDGAREGRTYELLSLPRAPARGFLSPAPGGRDQRGATLAAPARMARHMGHEEFHLIGKNATCVSLVGSPPVFGILS